MPCLPMPQPVGQGALCGGAFAGGAEEEPPYHIFRPALETSGPAPSGCPRDNLLLAACCEALNR